MRVALLLAFLAVPARAAGPTAGAAHADVTPPAGTPMAGYYSARAAEGVLDKLLARVLVVEKDGVKAALVGLDLIGTTPGLTAQTRARVEADTGIPGRHVMLFATHTHTGPVLTDGNPWADAFGGANPLAREYMAGLPGKIAAAVKAADAGRVPVRVRRAVGREDGLAFNRRYHIADGTVGWNPGKLNKDIVRPAGPTDPAVPVVVFETLAPTPKPVATCVNFAMHSDTVGGLYVSADYIGHLADALARVQGDGHVTVFGLGTCGDVNHLNTGSATPQKGAREAARIGTRLAAAALRAFDHLEPVADGPLVVSSSVVELPLAAVSEGELAAARAVIEKVRADAKPAPKFLDQVQAFKAADVADRLGKPIPAEVQVVSLGPDLAWVGLPGEIFVELGLTVKAGSPFRQTMCHTLANGSVGYVPTARGYAEGNYEAVSARCAAGSGEQLATEAIKQLRSRSVK